MNHARSSRLLFLFSFADLAINIFTLLRFRLMRGIKYSCRFVKISREGRLCQGHCLKSRTSVVWHFVKVFRVRSDLNDRVLSLLLTIVNSELSCDHPPNGPNKILKMHFFGFSEHSLDFRFLFVLQDRVQEKLIQSYNLK